MDGLVELIVDKYDGSLKAEHGTGVNMAPYLESEWGAKATELMWRVKRLADPDGVLSPGVVLSRDPGVHLRDLKTEPPIDGPASSCMECGFCEPVCPSREPDDDAAPADRPAAGDRPPAERLAAAGGAARGARLRGARHLRGGRQLPARLPGRDRHGQAGQGTARGATHAARRVAGAGDGEALGGGRVGVASGAAGRRPGGAADPQGPGAPRSGPGEAPGDDPRGRRRRLRPLVHEPDLRRRPDRRAGRRLGAGRAAGLDPRRRRGQLLRPAVELERVRRRPPPQGQRAGRATLGVERRGRAADRRRRRLLHRPDRRTGGGDAERGERRAPGGADDPRRRRLGPRSPPAEPRDHPQARRRGDPSDLRDQPPRPRPPPRRPRRGARRRRLRPADGDLLRLRRRPRHLPPRADRQRHPRRGIRARRPPLRRLPLEQPHLRDRHVPRHRQNLRVRDQRPRARHPPVTLTRAHHVGGPKTPVRLEFSARQPGVCDVTRASMSRRRAWALASRSIRLSSSGLIRPRKAE